MCWEIVEWTCFGFIVGAIARLFWPGRQPIGCLMTIVLGIVGSIVGGLLSYLLTGGPSTEYQPAGFIMSVIGAILFLWIAGGRYPRSLD